MAIEKIWVEDGCTACGLCEEICPEVFKVLDIATVLKGADYVVNEAGIKEAAESCPVEVIRFIA